MDILDIPFSLQLGALFGLVAIYVLFRSIELPRDYYEKQAARRKLKQKVEEMERVQRLQSEMTQEKI